MEHRKYKTEYGAIHYWINKIEKDRQTLVFLPGLTGDRRLFYKQMYYFEKTYNCLVWDAPGHGLSKIFRLEFSMDDEAEFLYQILEQEGIEKPVFVGQSMGGCVAQVFMELHPDTLAGFVSIDSCPVKREFYFRTELWPLKHMERLFCVCPWKRLVKSIALGNSKSKYGQKLMKKMVNQYTKEGYLKLVGFSYRILAEAVEKKRPYEIGCPAVLICGKQDRVGSVKRYNRKWAKKSGLPIFWIRDAGHNSNTDKPEKVNEIIEDFLEKSLSDDWKSGLSSVLETEKELE